MFVCLFQDDRKHSEARDDEGMGTADIKYGDTMVFVQHQSTGLWLSYQTYETKKKGVGKVEEKKVRVSKHIIACLEERKLQYRHVIPAPVDCLCVGTWLYKHPWITGQKNKPSTSVTHIPCESKFSCEAIHASTPEKLGGNQVCSHVLCPDLPRI